MQVQSYLFFDGRCEEAIEFYKKTLGAKVEMLMRFKEAPGKTTSARPAPRTRSCIQHAHRRHAGDGLRRHGAGQAGVQRLLAHARRPRTRPRPSKLFGALSDGGQVQSR